MRTLRDDLLQQALREFVALHVKLQQRDAPPIRLADRRQHFADRQELYQGFPLAELPAAGHLGPGGGVRDAGVLHENTERPRTRGGPVPGATQTSAERSRKLNLKAESGIIGLRVLIPVAPQVLWQVCRSDPVCGQRRHDHSGRLP